MLNEYIELWLGAFNNFIDDFYAYEEYKAIFVIIVSAFTILMITCILNTIIKGILLNFLRGYED